MRVDRHDWISALIAIGLPSRSYRSSEIREKASSTTKYNEKKCIHTHSLAPLSLTIRETFFIGVSRAILVRQYSSGSGTCCSFSYQCCFARTLVFPPLYCIWYMAPASPLGPPKIFSSMRIRRPFPGKFISKCLYKGDYLELCRESADIHYLIN